ncbi:MAG: SIS domain-containing protein [Candidatus Eisenbacteria bacterium]|nr:SIS domain-containing protein [Candidatus Eisenbacteria bacterium]
MSRSGVPAPAMRKLVEAFPDMLEQGWSTPREAASRLEPGRILVFAGMGGSGMAGAVASSFLQEKGRPTLVWLDAELPGWIGPLDRLVLISYSGETWEALSLLREAIVRGVPTHAIASGGRLLEECRNAGVPVSTVPPGLPPRASLPYLLAAALRAVRAEAEEEITAAVALLRAEAASPPAGREPKRIAEAMGNRIPVLIPVGPSRAVAALRWRNQILENAKRSCFVSGLPEMAHNEVMGWASLAGSGVPASFWAFPDPDREAPRTARLLEALREEAAASGLPFEVVAPAEASGLPGLLAEIFLGDRVSVELAEASGVDPVPVEAIRRLRAALAKEER